MIDLFILFTPILLLGIVALLGFVGCYTPIHVTNSDGSVTPASGPTAGGTVVTLGGTIIFGSASEVKDIVAKFDTPPNDINVPGAWLNTNQFTATTPPHPAGPVGVELDFESSDGEVIANVSLPSGSFFTYYDNVALLPPAALSRKNTGAVNTATLPAAAGIKLLVATVQWGAGGGAALTSLAAPGVAFIPTGTTDILNPQQVATFYAFADLTAGITVTATLSAATNTDFNLLLSAYDNVDPTSIPAVPLSKQGVGTSPAPAVVVPATTLAPGDLIYAVAIARNAATVLSGSWLPGTGFVGEVGQNDYLMLEIYLLQQSDIDAGQISVTATDADGTANSRWYIFAMAIKHV